MKSALRGINRRAPGRRASRVDKYELMLDSYRDDEAGILERKLDLEEGYTTANRVTVNIKTAILFSFDSESDSVY